MSAKKKDRSEWKLCVGCDCYFPRGVCVKHEKKCIVKDNSVLGITELNESTGSVLDSGFLKNGVLNGICKYIDRSSNNILPTPKNDLVIIHPSAVKLSNFQITSTVVIEYCGKRTYGTVWASSAIPVDAVGLKIPKMKTLGLEEGGIVAVSVMTCPFVIADKVVVDPISESAKIHFNDVFPTLVVELDDSNISNGDVISVAHYCEELFYRVKGICGDLSSENDFVSNVNDLDVSQLDNKFVSLSVDEDLNKKVASNIKVTGERKSPLFVYNFMSHTTQLELFVKKQDNSNDLHTSGSKYAINKIGGLKSQILLLEELIEKPFTYPSLYQECGITAPKGVIIYGVSGTGKTSLVHAFVSKLSNVYNITINGPELTSKFHGETEEKLRDVFFKTKQRSPAVLIIDEFDAICPSRSGSSSESEKRVVATLLTLLDSIGKDELFVVLAVTSKLDEIDIALRRSGRFDREIEIGVPNVEERSDILCKLMVDCKHSLSPADIMELSEVTHGYVGADLSALVKEAGLIAMKRLIGFLDKGTVVGVSDTSTDSNVLQPISVYSNINVECTKNFSVTMDDFRISLCKVCPSAMKAVVLDIPKVFWKDIGGQYSVKQKMKEAIEWPLKHPHAFKRLGITPPRGLLMYGPPGCSKTLIAKALATESGLNFISIKGPELFNKYLGESERAIREVFRKARLSAPSIIFFDEIDALGVQRSNKDSGGGNVGDRVLAQLLTELDGVESLEGVIIIAATNRPDIIDPALLRPGRIDRLVYVPLPDDDTRKEIFEIQFRSIPVSEDVELDLLVKMSIGYSGAEICSLCREAAMAALRENFDSHTVSLSHFKAIFKEIKPATSDDMVSFYNDYMHKTTGSF